MGKTFDVVSNRFERAFQDLLERLKRDIKHRPADLVPLGLRLQSIGRALADAVELQDYLNSSADAAWYREAFGAMVDVAILRESEIEHTGVLACLYVRQLFDKTLKEFKAAQPGNTQDAADDLACVTRIRALYYLFCLQLQVADKLKSEPVNIGDEEDALIQETDALKARWDIYLNRKSALEKIAS